MKLPLTLALLFFASIPAFAAGWRVGASAVDITPHEAMWQAGYEKRTAPASHAANSLWVKALAIDDGVGGRLMIVTLDLRRLPRFLRDHVAARAQRQLGIRGAALLVNVSHTHSGPTVTREEVEAPYRHLNRPADPVYVERAEAYEREVENRALQAIGEALRHEAPATLDFFHARAGFAMNRRLPSGLEILHEANPDGPVDPDVPVLRVTGPDGRIRALLYGYACHNTSVTTVVNEYTSDYSGFASQYLEAEYPGAVALFLQGAAGDQNPYPRGPVSYARRYGRSLADAVDGALSVIVHRSVDGPLRCAMGDANLPYAHEHYPWVKPGQQVPGSYLLPLQVIRFGSALTLVTMGGEPTVEYSLRLKRELAPSGAAVWFAGYSNDVSEYVGGAKVLEEGGYEGRDANARGNVHPGPFAPETEQAVFDEIHDLLEQTNH